MTPTEQTYTLVLATISNENASDKIETVKRIRLLTGNGVSNTMEAVSSLPTVILKNRPWSEIKIGLDLLNGGSIATAKFTDSHDKYPTVLINTEFNADNLAIIQKNYSVYVDPKIVFVSDNASSVQSPDGVTAVTGYTKEAGQPDWKSLTHTKKMPIFPVSLKEVQQIGQKAKGSTEGSVYYTIALNERVKLAARIRKTGTVSIRAEVKGAATPEEQKALEAAMTWHGGYGSTHLECGTIPTARVVGAYLMGLGIDFTAQVRSAKDLVTE